MGINVQQKDFEVLIDDGDFLHTNRRGNYSVTTEEGMLDLFSGDDIGMTATKNFLVLASEGDIQVECDSGKFDLLANKGDMKVKAALGQITIEAMKGIEIKCGQNSIKVDQSGITIKGMMVKLEGTVQTSIKGLMTEVKGDAMLQAKGAITMIG
jgi:type VI secretion system secreted protein VgrG